MQRNDWILALRSSLALLSLTLALFPCAESQRTLKVLYNFKGGHDAAAPLSGVTFDQKGDLYGTTAGGGTGKCGGGCGTVYKLTPSTTGEWVESVLHSFPYSADFGEGPIGGLVSDNVGRLYGTTWGGDEGGLLFRLNPPCGWSQYVLPFGGSAATLLMDSSGSLYGNLGDVYQITPDRTGWKQKSIYSFHPQNGQDGTDGLVPIGTLISDVAGNLYGVTKFGGNYSLCLSGGGCGTVFKLSPSADGKWREHVLHRFAKFDNDGQLPFAGLTMDPQGNLFGTTYQGGPYQTGAVFELKRGAGGQWKETILFDFPTLRDGQFPTQALVLDNKGNVYGVAAGGGGACNCGVVFKLIRGPHGKWSYTVLHHFIGSDGYFPESSLTIDGKGNLYGTTLFGGVYRYGVVYELTP
jgi:hypothetical protein